jgi:hypothetical protein
MATILPAYKVEKLEGKVVTQKVIYDKKAKEKGQVPIQYIHAKEDAGYLVTFPNGHSIRLSEKKLKAHGFDRDPLHIDMQSGEVVHDLSKIAQQRNKGAPLVNFAPDDEGVDNDD